MTSSTTYHGSKKGAWGIFTNFVIHLRLKFNLILVPLWFFGVYNSGVGPLYSWNIDFGKFWLQFFVLHICMYGGANSLNDYYDKDTGPIGGLKNPPPVDDSIFYLSWLIQSTGFFVCIFSQLPVSFIIWYIFGMILSFCYSHPAVRFKSYPYFSVIMVSFMQGFGAFCAGWIASEVPVSSIFSGRGILGGLGVQIMTAGVYPLSQIYQFKADKLKGDKTVTQLMGVDKSFKFSMVMMSLSCLCLFELLFLYDKKWLAVFVCMYMVGLIIYVNKWRTTFVVNDVLYNFGVLHKVAFTNSFCFMMFSLGKIFDLI